MNSCIKIGVPKYIGNRFVIPFSVPDMLNAYFRTNSFWFECSDVSDLPESIAVAPAVANLIPFSWVFKCALEVRSLDSSFFYSLSKIKNGYTNMLYKLELGGELKVDNIINNSVGRMPSNPLLLFSGGADAWCSLVRHVDESPHLVSIWGADISVNNVEGWTIVDSHSKSVANTFGISYSSVRSNLMDMIDYRVLDNSPMMRAAGYHWWHDLQHGIGLLGLAAPLAYTVNAPLIYIASSFYVGDKGYYTCASDPTIDNMFSIGLTRGSHDGYELTRQDKISAIVKYANKSNMHIDLRVCYHARTGRNCCHCEKCGRTILGIYAAGGNPREFGFTFSIITLLFLSLKMRFFYRMKMAHYRYISSSAEANKNNVPLIFGWIYSSNLDRICDNHFKRTWELFHNFGADLYHKLIGQ